VTHIFISYSRKNLESAQNIVDALAEKEMKTWVDWKSIPSGEDWWERIRMGIEEADSFLFLISEDSVKSEVCLKEIEQAVKNNKRILPVVIRDVPPEETHTEIAKRNWIFCREGDDFENATQRIIDTLNTDFEWLQFHTRLQVKALEWDREDRDTSLLLHGNELREAEQFLAKSTPESEPLPTELQRQYVELSQKNEKRRKYLIAIVAFLILGLVAGPILLREKAIPGQWVSIPAENFVMGMDEEEAAFANSSCQEGAFDPSGCTPADELLTWSGRQVDTALDEYAILENEVTNGQYKQCVDAGSCTPSDDWTYKSNTLNQPATMLNWYQAGEYCAWLGGRLPTEAEWEKAARGSEGNYYPWGNTWDRNKANLENFGVESVQSVAKYASSDLSPYGVMNMAGNVQEWTASELSYLAEGQTFTNPILEREDDGSDWPVIVRGGSWKNERSEGMGSYRGVESILGRREEVGFRCICPDSNNKPCEKPWNGWWIWFHK